MQCKLTQYGNWCELGNGAGFLSLKTCTLSHILVAANTKSAVLISCPATACRHAAQSRMKCLTILSSGYLFWELHFCRSGGMGNLKSSMSNTSSVEPELPLLSSKFFWAVELPEADDADLWLIELDDRPEATEATDCGVDLPDPADDRGTNPVDVHVSGDIGGHGVNGLDVWVNGASNSKDCNKSFDLLSCALLRWQLSWLYNFLLLITLVQFTKGLLTCLNLNIPNTTFV